MDAAEVAVTVGGILAMAAVGWFFLLGRRPGARAQSEAGGLQRIRVTVRGGYDPSVIVVRRGRPVRIEFYRDETSGCSDTVVFPDFGIAQPLAPYRTTALELTPERTGEFEFTCGMNMLRGRLVVEPDEEAAG